MSLGGDVTTRLLAKVPDLGNRIGTAAQLADAMAKNRLPQVTPAAFVIPLGLRGGQSNAATGLFRQGLDRLVGVVLVIRSAGDLLGEKASEELEPLIEKTIEAIAGWEPGSAIGVFRLGQGQLVSMNGGAVTYQLDFILDDQLRITP